MTIMWTTQETADPGLAWLPFGPDQEEQEYLNFPVPGAVPCAKEIRGNLTNLQIEGPGLGEIKPHTKDGIGKAVEQFENWGHDWENQRMKWGLAADPTFKDFNSLKKVIITYRPSDWSADYKNKHPRHIDIFAIEHKPGELKPMRLKSKKPNAPDRFSPAKYWGDLKDSWMRVAQCVPVKPQVEVNLENPALFGMAMEDWIRERFVGLLPAGRTGFNVHKSSAAHGPDVMWTEIAEMYAELARLTNDEFLAELANELAMLR